VAGHVLGDSRRPKAANDISESCTAVALSLLFVVLLFFSGLRRTMAQVHFQILPAKAPVSPGLKHTAQRETEVPRTIIPLNTIQISTVLSRDALYDVDVDVKWRRRR
jgi:hypothetical protein